MKKNQDLTFIATCEGGSALVDLFVQDGSFKGASRDNLRNCEGWEEDVGVAYYQFEIACGAGRGLQQSRLGFFFIHTRRKLRRRNARCCHYWRRIGSETLVLKKYYYYVDVEFSKLNVYLHKKDTMPLECGAVCSDTFVSPFLTIV